MGVLYSIHIKNPHIFLDVTKDMLVLLYIIVFTLWSMAKNRLLTLGTK